MQTYTLTIQKSPGGGYAMTHAVTDDADGQIPFASCSTLHEVFQRLVHPIVQQHFGEAPVYYSQPPQPPPVVQEQFDLPIVATGPQPPQEPGGLMSRFNGGYSSTVVPMLWLGALALGVKLSGMV
jgi:hypothetical protein